MLHQRSEATAPCVNICQSDLTDVFCVSNKNHSPHSCYEGVHYSKSLKAFYTGLQTWF